MKFIHIACTAVLLASLVLQGRCSNFRGLLAESQRDGSSEEESEEEPSTPAPLQVDNQVNVTSDSEDDIPEVIVNIAPSDETQTKPIIHPEQIRHKKSPYCVQVQNSPYGAPQTICDHHVSAIPQGQNIIPEEMPGMVVHQDVDPVHHLAQAALASAALGTSAHTFYNQQEQPASMVTYHPPNPYQSSTPMQQVGPVLNAPFFQPQVHSAPVQIQQHTSFPTFQPSPPVFNNIGSYRSSDYSSTPVIQTPSFQSQPNPSFNNGLQLSFGNQPSPHTFSVPSQPYYSHPAPPAVICQPASHPPTLYNTQTYGQPPLSHSYSAPPQQIPTSYNAPSSHAYSSQPQHSSQSFNSHSYGSSHSAPVSHFNTQPQPSYGSYQSQQTYGTNSYSPPFYGNPNDMSEPQSVKLMPSFTSAGVTEKYREAESEKKDLNQTSDSSNSTAPNQAPRDSEYNAPNMYQHVAHNAPFAYNTHKYTQPSNTGANYAHSPSFNPSLAFKPSNYNPASFPPQKNIPSSPSFNPTPSYISSPGFNFAPSAPIYNPTPQFSTGLPFSLNTPAYPIFENTPINNIPLSFNPVPFSLFAPSAPINTPILSGPIFSQGAIPSYNTGSLAKNNEGALCTAYGPRGTPVPLRIVCHVQPLDAPQTPINFQSPSYRDDNDPQVQVDKDKDKDKDDDKSSSSEEDKLKTEVTTNRIVEVGKVSQQAINNLTSDQTGDASKARQSSQPQPAGQQLKQGFQQGSMSSQLGRPTSPIGQDSRGGQQVGQSGQHSSQGGQRPGHPGQLFSQHQVPTKQSFISSGQHLGQSGARAAYGGGWGGDPNLGPWNMSPNVGQRFVRYPAPPFPQFGPDFYN